MSVVKINVVTMPEDKRARFEERFRGRAGGVETTPGFESFECCGPVAGTNQYLFYTRWESEEASRPGSRAEFDRAHDGGGDTRPRPPDSTTSGATRWWSPRGPHDRVGGRPTTAAATVAASARGAPGPACRMPGPARRRWEP